MSDQTDKATLERDEETNEAGPLTAAEDPEVVTAAEGAGPLLQRDYWAVIEGTKYTPQQVIQKVKEEFPCFSPDLIAAFKRIDDNDGPLPEDGAMEVHIKGSGICEVRVVHMDDQSFTLRTITGHPEAGRITFGAYYDRVGRLKFRIRSRARSSDLLQFVGYQLLGQAMQTKVWTTFVERVAEACGGHIHGEIQVETRNVDDSPADLGKVDYPTFIASRES